MKFSLWNKRLLKHFSLYSDGGSATLKQPDSLLHYQLLTVCKISHLVQVEALISLDLQNLRQQVLAYRYSAEASGQLVCITVDLRCTSAQRQQLVQLVSRLGLEACVRSARWQMTSALR
jgi:uncharacterized membrane protein YhiD involved in acid resistance